MGRMLSLACAHEIRIRQLLVTFCVLAICVAACQPVTPAAPVGPSLTSPPPATVSPTMINPTPTDTDAAAASATAPRPTPTSSQSMPTPTRTLPPTTAPSGTERSLRLQTPALTPADAAAGLTQMLEAITRPRSINADAMWAFFISDRTIPTSSAGAEAEETQAKLLEMWHSDNVCYAKLEEEIAVLGQDNQVSPVGYRQYLDYINGELSPCLDEQLPLVDAQQFFGNSTAIRAERITKWLNASWLELEEEGQLPDTAPCGDIFDAHLPDAIAAADPEQLSAAWSAALNERFQCQYEPLQQANEFSDLGDAHLFTLSLHDRRTIITLQTTLMGHVIAIGLGRSYDECWSDFAASIPEMAAVNDPAELYDARNAALEALYACIAKLPVTNPFVQER